MFGKRVGSRSPSLRALFCLRKDFFHRSVMPSEASTSSKSEPASAHAPVTESFSPKQRQRARQRCGQEKSRAASALRDRTHRREVKQLTRTISALQQSAALMTPRRARPGSTTPSIRQSHLLATPPPPSRRRRSKSHVRSVHPLRRVTRSAGSSNGTRESRKRSRYHGSMDRAVSWVPFVLCT